MAGRPKGNKPDKKQKISMYCNGCNKEHIEDEFYVTYNPIYESRKDGSGNMRMPFCKDFIVKQCTNEDGSENPDKLKELLVQLDAPFLEDYWNAAKEENGNTLRIYFKNLSLKQNRGLKWKDSTSNCETPETIKSLNLNNENVNFIVTNEMRHRWGSNYSITQVMDLEKFYNDMRMTHTIVTPQHVKALILLCKMQLKLDIFLESDDMASFAKLHDQYQKLLQSSGLRPIDKVGGDEATGMRSFSHIFEEVEKKGYIKPKKYNPPQDKLDHTIMYIENGTRRLVGQQILTEPPINTSKDFNTEGDYIE